MAEQPAHTRVKQPPPSLPHHQKTTQQRRPPRTKHRGHEEHVGRGVDQVAERLVVREHERRAVGVLLEQLLAQRVKLGLHLCALFGFWLLLL